MIFTMELEKMKKNPVNQKLGIHYYQDTLNYKESDLHKWLPRLKELNISWLTLLSDVDRAIPEQFLRGVIDSGIKPIIHFKQQPRNVLFAWIEIPNG